MVKSTRADGIPSRHEQNIVAGIEKQHLHAAKRLIAYHFGPPLEDRKSYSSKVYNTFKIVLGLNFGT